MRESADEHAITVSGHEGRVRVRFNGRIVAETTRALELREAGCAPVFYIPRSDAEMSLFEGSAHSTRCPFKGEACYFTLRVGARESANAVWSYERPYPGVAAIKEHLAFYPERVDSIEALPA